MIVLDTWTCEFKPASPPDVSSHSQRRYFVLKKYKHIQKKGDKAIKDTIFLSGIRKATKVTASELNKAPKHDWLHQLIVSNEKVSQMSMQLYVVARDELDAEDKAGQLKRLCSKAIHWANTMWLAPKQGKESTSLWTARKTTDYEALNLRLLKRLGIEPRPVLPPRPAEAPKDNKVVSTPNNSIPTKDLLGNVLNRIKTLTLSVSLNQVSNK